jgi:hypothetical protein
MFLWEKNKINNNIKWDDKENDIGTKSLIKM